MRGDSLARASVDKREGARACGGSHPQWNGRAGVDHASQSCTTSCRIVSRRRDAASARLPVRPAVGVCQTMRAVYLHRQMPVPRVTVQPGILVVWMSLRARRHTVARTAVAQFSADMEVITRAHVHVQGPKMLTYCPCTRSSMKHVDPCTGCLASPLHALSPSSSSTFKSFVNSTCTLSTLLTGMCKPTRVSFRGDAVTQLLGDGDPRNLNLLLTTNFTTGLSTPGPPVVSNWGPTVSSKYIFWLLEFVHGQ